MLISLFSNLKNKKFINIFNKFVYSKYYLVFIGALVVLSALAGFELPVYYIILIVSILLPALFSEDMLPALAPLLMCYCSLSLKHNNTFTGYSAFKENSFLNEVTKSLIASGSNKNKIELIYHGVKENDLVAPSNDSKLKFGVNTNLVVVSSASRFSREKGNSFFIKSTSKLVERYENEHKDINFKILLANEGPLLEDCKTLVEILNLNDVVTFAGYQKDMKDFYMASDIYVTSSQSEGLGLATIESLNYGIPNIVTNIGGLTEIVNEETNCGLTVPYNDEYEFANKLYTLINDNELRNKFKINAKEVIKNNFSINKMIEKTLNVYNEILKQK